MKEYCNPLNLNYKYQHYGENAHREGADPTLIFFKGKYYLFVSMSAGFYYSDDLTHWQWHENRNLDMYHYAPDVRQVGDWLYFCASNKGESCTIWRTGDPLSDQFEKVSAPFDFWDPDLFCDDDGRVYLYWGSSNQEPIWGVELDRDTMTPIGEKQGLIPENKDAHGWERFNYPGKPRVKRPFPDSFWYWYYFSRPGKPFLEGPYMTSGTGGIISSMLPPTPRHPSTPMGTTSVIRPWAHLLTPPTRPSAWPLAVLSRARATAAPLRTNSATSGTRRPCASA